MKTLSNLGRIGFYLILSWQFVGCGGDSGGGKGAQIDRMGFPAINTALIFTEDKDRYNNGDPESDIKVFREEVIRHIEESREDFDQVSGFPDQDQVGITPEALASIVNPDTLTIDLSKPVIFPNGRRLEDDVIDPTLGLVLNRGDVLLAGPGVSDGISLDSTFIDTFPYLGVPNL